MRGVSSGSSQVWFRSGACVLGLALVAICGVKARAAVTEPPVQPATTGESVPKPSTSSELSLITSRGFTMMDGTLQGLFMSRGESIDYVKDAQTTPGTFAPQCLASVQLVLAAGGCPMGIGWYNVTPGSTTPPSQDQLHALVPAQFPKCPATIDPAVACCDDSDFCPLASYDTTQMPQHRWSMPAYSSDLIRNDAQYAGGLVGFVLMGVGSVDGRCNQNKYSQVELNQLSPNGQPWVGALVYRSTVDPSSYYVGFEGLPTTAQSWKGQNNSNDGDFNDQVIWVRGAGCPATGAMGGAAGMAGAGGGGAGGGGTTGGGAGSPATGGAPAAGGSSATGGSSVATGGSVGAGGGLAATGGSLGSGGGVAAGGSAPVIMGSGGAAAGVSGTGGSAAASGSKSGCTYSGNLTGGTVGTFALGLILALRFRKRKGASSSLGRR